MSTHKNRVRMVETTLLRRILVLIRLAHCVAMGLSYESLSHPTVMRNRCVSAFLVLIDTKICPYVALLPAGNLEWLMKKMVFVPLTRFPTPCASLTISLDKTVVQVPLSGPLISYV